MTIHPDGRVEGTPQELAEYAQAIRRQMDAARHPMAEPRPSTVYVLTGPSDPRIPRVPGYPAPPSGA